MAATPGSSATATYASSGAPSVAVPAGAVAGDRIYALLAYFGSTGSPVAPEGWTQLAKTPMVPTAADPTVPAANTAGWFSLVWRTMATGVTAAQWSITAVDASSGVYAKSVATAIVVKGGSGHTLGTVFTRPSASTSSVLPGVNVPTDGLLLAFATDRVSSQTSVAAPASMTEQAKYVYGGGGGGSAIIATEATPGASGTRTFTYGLASAQAAGVMLAITATTSTATPPTLTGTVKVADAVAAAARPGVTVTAAVTVTGSYTATSWAVRAESVPVDLAGSGLSRTFTVPYLQGDGGDILIDVTATGPGGTSTPLLLAIKALPQTDWWLDSDGTWRPVKARVLVTSPAGTTPGSNGAGTFLLSQDTDGHYFVTATGTRALLVDTDGHLYVGPAGQPGGALAVDTDGHYYYSPGA